MSQEQTISTNKYTYTVALEPAEEGGYTATVPALPGVVTEGDTLDEAVAMAKEAIELHIEGLRDDGQPIPREEDILHRKVDVQLKAG